ncbi:MAG: cold shock domain-containing protein [Planctomycetes bacterium]|nr:cold shock domain-containing protein [Planctomycetota bacterium]
MAHTKVRTHGKIKWFDTTKGFGFLVRGGEAPIFLHIGRVIGPVEMLLKPGAEMEFTVEVTKHGPIATEAKLIT